MHFRWDDECQESFNHLKNVLSELVMPVHPDQIKEYKLYTDAVDLAIRDFLMQHIFYKTTNKGNGKICILFISQTE